MQRLRLAATKGRTLVGVILIETGLALVRAGTGLLPRSSE
ncbi:hypothetical protein Q011_02683 [Pseudomonas aeruginosa 6077]|uniref:Uncharacterized protein n=2 Tax=Casadabanvirus TaxID=1623286 RepID=L7P7L8_9CAUD|nr:hypothetical protein H380_gp25 [Pseudomonas phage JBD30]YP_009273651.1 hypothetical protein BH778_gp26 [Pseudomonas phage JBD69]AZP58402.1 Uncharacterized protein PA1840_1208 [Pseudomonas aeruginosa]ERX38860.1 hypothetical protein Q011_02683 [Pseudomonas aeruginosa 6077]ERZ05190.1 hypothetical protein Q020_03826 [Pseudomonas aeruginosa BWHPSA007]EZO98389.1 hypothetical protein V554_02107 [Pseudomonas aeruginosa BWH053]CAI9416715.1 hypothetical protein LGHFLMMC_03389 [Pseudomonas sp. T2.1D-